MSQYPAYIETKVISFDNPSTNSFIDLSQAIYGLPRSISLYGISGVIKSPEVNSVSVYQEFYDGNSGDAIMVFDAQSPPFHPFLDVLMPYSSFMEDDSSIRISDGLNVFFRSASSIPYSSFTVFYK